MPNFRTLFQTATTLALLATAASANPHTPRKGSAERTAIMSALHRVLGGGKHTPRITADTFNVESGWAFVVGQFDYADGAPLEEEYRGGAGSTFQALLQHEGKSWRVKRRIYADDVENDEFMHDFPAAPHSVFRFK